MRIIGVDPGSDGGIAFLNDKNVLAAIKIPSYKYTVGSGKKQKTRKMVDGKEIGKLFKKFKPDLVYIEKVGAMPNQGTVSMFNFGFSTGILHGICLALDIDFKTVRPQEWKEVVLENTDKDKNAAIQFCEKNFPHVSLLPTERSKNPHDGIADAICIAVYGVSQININSREESK